MKQVIEQYASAVITSLVVLVFLRILFGGVGESGFHVTSLLGEVLKYSMAQSSFQENQAFDEYMNYGVPEIYVKEEIYLRVNQSIPLSHCIEAHDAFGEALEINIREMKNAYGNQLDVEQINETKQLCFSLPGVYWLHAYAVDENQKETNVMVKLLVNEG